MLLKAASLIFESELLEKHTHTSIQGTVQKSFIEQLEQLKTSQQSGVKGPNLFSNANLDAVLGILDPTNQKHITFAQYKQGEHRTLHLFIESHYK